MRSDVRVLPSEFLDRLRQLIPSSRWDAVANTFTEPPPTTFRVNTLKAAVPDVRERLTALGFHLEGVPWCREAFLLRRGSLRELQATDPYQHGELYVQGLSSMLPALVLAPQPGETVLDLTAAPGSKTTQIACLMRGQGRMIANDNNRIRFFKLKANVEAQGASNVELSLRAGEVLGRTHPGVFDRVLVDAPCSAEGRFQVREPASLRYWKPRKVQEMARKQRRLLASGLAAVKPGGVLVYSTCTFAPEENEGMVDWALSKFGAAVMLEPIALELPNRMPGLTRWEGKVFDPSVARTARILPTPDMEGFFLARFRKRADA